MTWLYKKKKYKVVKVIGEIERRKLPAPMIEVCGKLWTLKECHDAENRFCEDSVRKYPRGKPGGYTREEWWENICKYLRGEKVEL